MCEQAVRALVAISNEEADPCGPRYVGGAKEQLAAGSNGGLEPLPGAERPEALADRGVSREPLQMCARHGITLANPVARGGRVECFEPSKRVGHGNAVKRVHDAGRGGGRALRTRCGRQQHCDEEKRRMQSHVHQQPR